MFDFDKFSDMDSATTCRSKNTAIYSSKNTATYSSTISDVKNTEEEDAAAESLAKQMEELNRKNEESNRRLREQAEAEKLKREKEEEERVRELEAAVVKQKIDKEAEERKAFYEELKSEYEKDKSESHSAEKKQSIFSAFLSPKQKAKAKPTDSSKVRSTNSKKQKASKSGDLLPDKKAKKQTGDSLKRLIPFVSKNKSDDSSNHPDTEKEPESEELKSAEQTSEPSHSKGEELKTESVTPTPKDDTVSQNGVDHRSTPRSDAKHHSITETVSQKDESPKDEELEVENRIPEPLQRDEEGLKTTSQTSEPLRSKGEELKSEGRTSEPLQNESKESKATQTPVPNGTVLKEPFLGVDRRSTPLKNNSMFDVFSGLTNQYSTAVFIYAGWIFDFAMVL